MSPEWWHPARHRLLHGLTIACVTSKGPAARPLLRVDELREALISQGRLWRDVRVVPETGSTNSDLLAEAKNGLAEGAVLAAETQSAGRGRLGRTWVSPPGAALTFSVLLRPAAVAPASRGWIPLLAGVAVARAVRAGTEIEAWLKWPNDVQANGAKLAGILAEQAGDAVVVGIGINVSSGPEELPVATATSLALEGAQDPAPGPLLVAVLGELERWYVDWANRGGDAVGSGLHQEYQRLCATLGREVRVSLPGGRIVTGTAHEVDRAGRLVVQSPSGPVPVSAGDVVHVR
jgi:BirA family transcriptional regulator, biotin operon repressor / biotin---[acetyl-CoA-carboxylase] ligase